MLANEEGTNVLYSIPAVRRQRHRVLPLLYFVIRIVVE